MATNKQDELSRLVENFKKSKNTNKTYKLRV